MRTDIICFLREDEALLMRTHNICFLREVRKMSIFWQVILVGQTEFDIYLSVDKQ